MGDSVAFHQYAVLQQKPQTATATGTTPDDPWLASQDKAPTLTSGYDQQVRAKTAADKKRNKIKKQLLDIERIKTIAKEYEMLREVESQQRKMLLE